MTRIVKEPEVRRAELLDCAEALFFSRGYEATGVSDIIAAAGVSKGAFYHYFDAKESLLAAISDRLVDRSLEGSRAALEDAGLDPLGRLNAFLSVSRRMNVEIAPSVRGWLRVVLRPENAALRERINAVTIEKVAPVLAGVLEQGAARGVFATPDPLGSAELLLHLGTGVHGTIARALEASEGGALEAAVEMLDRRLRLYEAAFNRVLGLPDDAVRLVEPGFAAAVLGG